MIYTVYLNSLYSLTWLSFIIIFLFLLIHFFWFSALLLYFYYISINIVNFVELCDNNIFDALPLISDNNQN